MKLLSFNISGKATYGAVSDGGIVDIGARLGSRYPDIKALLAADALSELSSLVESLAADYPVEQPDFLPVIVNPGKIFCIGLNYESHRKETGRDRSGHPVVFTRFADTQVGHRQPLGVPRVSGQLDYEGELAVVIGRGGRAIDKASAMQHVAGYSCYNDASVRDWQSHTSQFTPGKNFPQTGSLGPYLVTADEIDDVHNLSIRTRLNGEVMQDSNTCRLIFDIPAIIEYISAFTSLSAGDVIATGTPGGVGFTREPQVYLKPGDEVVVDIEKVGSLVNPVIAGA
ncbi:MAG: fumarylacetoacetate hydrolase family protein [Gammaproteobacteria bacterium]